MGASLRKTGDRGAGIIRHSPPETAAPGGAEKQGTVRGVATCPQGPGALASSLPATPCPSIYTAPNTWPCLFLLSSGRWVSGEPEVQRRPGQWGSSPGPCGSQPWLSPEPDKVPPAPCRPKRPPAELTLWAAAAPAITQGPGEREGEDTQSAGGAGGAVPSFSGSPGAY